MSSLREVNTRARSSYGGLPVPGATVTASSGDKKLVTATDEEGVFRLPDATAGIWTLKVEMLGFEMLTRDVTVTAEPQPSAWTLALRPFDRHHTRDSAACTRLPRLLLRRRRRVALPRRPLRRKDEEAFNGLA